MNDHTPTRPDDDRVASALLAALMGPQSAIGIGRVMARQAGQMPVAAAEREEIAAAAFAIIRRRVGDNDDVIRDIALSVAELALHPDDFRARQSLWRARREHPFIDDEDEDEDAEDRRAEEWRDARLNQED